MEPYRRSHTSSLWPQRQPEVSIVSDLLRIQDGTSTLQIWEIFLHSKFFLSEYTLLEASECMMVGCTTRCTYDQTKSEALSLTISTASCTTHHHTRRGF